MRWRRAASCDSTARASAIRSCSSSPPGSLLLLGRPPLARAAGAGLGGAGAGSSAGSRGALPHVPRADAALLRAVAGRAVLLRRSPAPRSDRSSVDDCDLESTRSYVCRRRCSAACASGDARSGGRSASAPSGCEAASASASASTSARACASAARNESAGAAGGCASSCAESSLPVSSELALVSAKARRRRCATGVRRYAATASAICSPYSSSEDDDMALALATGETLQRWSVQVANRAELRNGFRTGSAPAVDSVDRALPAGSLIPMRPLTCKAVIY